MSGQSVLRSWLVFQITGNELALGLISALVALPMLLMAPVGGIFADRFDRRRVVAAGQLLVIGGELGVFALLVTGHLEYWHLLLMEATDGDRVPADHAGAPGDHRQHRRSRPHDQRDGPQHGGGLDHARGRAGARRVSPSRTSASRGPTAPTSSST